MSGALSQEKLNTLLHRAIADDGPEGQVAFEMFRARAKAKRCQLEYIEDDEPFGAAWIIRSYKERVAKLETEIGDLRERMQKESKHLKHMAARLDQA